MLCFGSFKEFFERLGDETVPKRDYLERQGLDLLLEWPEQKKVTAVRKPVQLSLFLAAKNRLGSNCAVRKQIVDSLSEEDRQQSVQQHRPPLANIFIGNMNGII